MKSYSYQYARRRGCVGLNNPFRLRYSQGKDGTLKAINPQPEDVLTKEELVAYSKDKNLLKMFAKRVETRADGNRYENEKDLLRNIFGKQRANLIISIYEKYYRNVCNAPA